MSSSVTNDNHYSPPPSERKPKRRRKREQKTTVELIDDFFRSDVVVVEDGVRRRRKALKVILDQLSNEAMTGNSRALNVLGQYREFIKSRSGGLPYRVKWVPDEEYYRNLKEENAKRRSNG